MNEEAALDAGETFRSTSPTLPTVSTTMSGGGGWGGGLWQILAIMEWSDLFTKTHNFKINEDLVTKHDSQL